VTKAYAQKVLQSPRFGDPECIEAVQRLADEPRVQRLRTLLAGKYHTCPACGNDGGNCTVCENDGRIEITKALVDTWEIDILLAVVEELDIEVDA
jgi:hypothetical protein